MEVISVYDKTFRMVTIKYEKDGQPHEELQCWDSSNEEHPVFRVVTAPDSINGHKVRHTEAVFGEAVYDI